MQHNSKIRVLISSLKFDNTKIKICLMNGPVNLLDWNLDSLGRKELDFVSCQHIMISAQKPSGCYLSSFSNLIRSKPAKTIEQFDRSSI